MLKVRDLTLSIGAQTIVQAVSFTCEPGTFTSLIGPNGAGKSTLLRGIAGALPPAAGAVVCRDQDVTTLSFRRRAQRIAYLPQTLYYDKGYTVADFIALANHPWAGTPEALSFESRMEEALTVCQVRELRDRYLHTLSGGERQRVFLAQVVFQNTPVILLDEPTTFLDLKHVLQIEGTLKILQEKGRTILCVTHDLFLARQLSTHALALKQGKTFCGGTASDVLNSPALSRLFDVEEAFLCRRYPLEGAIPSG
jgi:iron complex transport system ATP-binding protein